MNEKRAARIGELERRFLVSDRAKVDGLFTEREEKFLKLVEERAESEKFYDSGKTEETVIDALVASVLRTTKKWGELPQTSINVRNRNVFVMITESEFYVDGLQQLILDLAWAFNVPQDAR